MVHVRVCFQSYPLYFTRLKLTSEWKLYIAWCGYQPLGPRYVILAIMCLPIACLCVSPEATYGKQRGTLNGEFDGGNLIFTIQKVGHLLIHWLVKSPPLTQVVWCRPPPRQSKGLVKIQIQNHFLPPKFGGSQLMRAYDVINRSSNMLLSNRMQM